MLILSLNNNINQNNEENYIFFKKEIIFLKILFKDKYTISFN